MEASFLFARGTRIGRRLCSLLYGPNVCFLIILVFFLFCFDYGNALGEVIYAVNCGGGPHTDLNGVHYQADKLSIGTASDFGKSLQIDRVAPADQILYQTERYNIADFGYNIPIQEEGDFVLVLKFCEVYFRGSKLKVFDVRLNQAHMVLKDFDIYDKVGYGVAHDEYIPFAIKNGVLKVGPYSSPFPGQLYVEFIKSYYDNPKVNALVVFRGTENDVPRLPKLQEAQEKPIEELEEEPEYQPKPKKDRKTSGPKSSDPYEADDSSYFYPVLIALGLFIPSVLCLCKL